MAIGLFKTSLVKKYWMALTGIFLITFLVVHCVINAMIFFNDGGLMFNSAAHFMGHNVLIRTAEIGLFVGLLVHIIDGLWLYFENRKARPINYAYTNNGKSSTWYSRSMALLGTLLLLFLVLHLWHFWLPSRSIVGSLEPQGLDGNGHENLFKLMTQVFSNPIPVVIYVLGCIALFWHLLHGFKSAFQSLGFNHTKYKAAIAFAGDAFSVIVPAIFAAMPIAMYLKWIA